MLILCISMGYLLRATRASRFEAWKPERQTVSVQIRPSVAGPSGMFDYPSAFQVSPADLRMWGFSGQDFQILHGLLVQTSSRQGSTRGGTRRYNVINTRQINWEEQGLVYGCYSAATAEAPSSEYRIGIDLRPASITTV
ncbi:hypothetical protein B0H19DRAFT_484343 [Mycena capillaripes]|nr:hypothetical protein B0H19DRAFT_484343 [Mycena capillaripes]